MTHLSIIGRGTMARAVAEVATRGGNTADLLGRDAGEPLTGDVVVLAVPYPALADVVARRGDQLAGRIVVDITNPLDFQTLDALVVPADSSATAELAARLPRSRVLKAFSTNFAATLVSGTVGDGAPTTVLVAGDDEDAKATLSGVITSAGLTALDAGPLRRARELESLGLLQLGMAVAGRLSWTGGLTVAS